MGKILIRKGLCWDHNRMIVYHIRTMMVLRSEKYPCFRGLNLFRKGCSCCQTRDRKDLWRLRGHMGLWRAMDRKDLWCVRGRKDP